MAVNSLVTIPVDAKAWIVAATTFLLSIALAAMGLETNIGKLPYPRTAPQANRVGIVLGALFV